METADSLRRKAAQCRRLAGGILRKTDPTRVSLLEMADEYERRAATVEAEEATSAKRQRDRSSGES
jgi:hypothetical protein